MKPSTGRTVKFYCGFFADVLGFVLIFAALYLALICL
jgi:hypothetical protein